MLVLDAIFKNQPTSGRPPQVKYRKTEVVQNVHKIPVPQFQHQKLTSFAGLIIFQKYFQKIKLRQELKKCFEHLSSISVYAPERIIMILMINIFLGFRKLSAVQDLKNDPLYMRVLGLKKLPTSSTISRSLQRMDKASYSKLRKLTRDKVLSRLEKENLSRITLDFDGSICSTKSRKTEGTAVGFNKQKKGSRSYYPLFCTVAQTGQVLDHKHRPGNVHDSKHSLAFMKFCFRSIRKKLPGVILESRMDSAFFSEKTLLLLNSEDVHFTISVPFHRFAKLKAIVLQRQRWSKADENCDYFEIDWKPASWNASQNFKFIAIRKKTHKLRKKPIQYDLFEPFDEIYEYKVILTNMSMPANQVLNFHNGRGSQEGIFSELKSDSWMHYIPTQRLISNQIYLATTILAHNEIKELQMITGSRQRKEDNEVRPALWKFKKLRTFRWQSLQIAGRLIRPQGRLTLQMNLIGKTRENFLGILKKLNFAA